jgi:hypothetical protein
LTGKSHRKKDLQHPQQQLEHWQRLALLQPSLSSLLPRQRMQQPTIQKVRRGDDVPLQLYLPPWRQSLRFVSSLRQLRPLRPALWATMRWWDHSQSWNA